MDQLRKFGRTIEMLSDPSVQRINTSTEMSEWWEHEIERSRQHVPPVKGDQKDAVVSSPETNANAQLGGDGAAAGDQWAGKLPGRGGT